MVYEHLHGLVPVILRVANAYGERQRAETAQGAVGVFLTKVLRGEPLEIWGDGSVIRDYIYVGDVADAFLRAVSYTGPKRVFNVSSGIGTSLNEIIDGLEAVLGKPIIRRYGPPRAFDSNVNVLSNALAARELGWMPSVSLLDGIARTAKWLQANG